jgi:hypothetical protein
VPHANRWVAARSGMSGRAMVGMILDLAGRIHHHDRQAGDGVVLHRL